MKKYLPLIVLDMGALAVIAYTVWLGNHADWTLYNLSVVGYWYGYSRELIIWGWITAAVFMSFLFYLERMYRLQSKIVNLFVVVAAILLIVGVYLPYQPWEYPVLSNLHIAISFLAPVCLVVSICALLVQLQKRRVVGMRILMAVMALCLIMAAVIFVKFTIITTVLEVFVVSALTVFMTILAIIAGKIE